jgi:ankyrin repeat protein
MDNDIDNDNDNDNDAPSNKKRSFWDSTIGTIAKITAFVTALTGLIVAIKSIWPSSSGKEQTQSVVGQPDTNGSTGATNSDNNSGGSSENSPKTVQTPPATYTDYLQMMQAIRDNKTQDAIAEIKNGADVNKNDAEGYSPLIRAIYAENFLVVEALVKHKANVNSTDNKISSTPLIEASYLGLIDVVRLLLQNNADPNISKHGYTALMASTNKEQPFNHAHKLVFCELLSHGADPDAKFNGSTALDFVKGDWPADVADVQNMINNCKK